MAQFTWQGPREQYDQHRHHAVSRVRLHYVRRLASLLTVELRLNDSCGGSWDLCLGCGFTRWHSPMPEG